MSVFRRMFETKKSTEPEDGGFFDKLTPLLPVNAREAQHNPFDEIQLLQSHMDIVRFLIDLGDGRIASASDDRNVIVWHVPDGRRVCTLEGHRLPVTCGLVLGERLATGSSDRTIRIWDVDDGRCLSVITEHGSTVKCACHLGFGLWCCAGSQISVLSAAGQLMSKLSRNEEDSDIHGVLVIQNRRLVTISQSSREAIVYNLQGDQSEFGAVITMYRHLPAHRDVIRCVQAVTDAMFATASLDGAIILWSANSLTQAKKLNVHEVYQNPKTHVYMHSVQALLVHESFLIAAIGNGFEISDVLSGQVLASAPGAHQSTVNHLIVLPATRQLITCSADASIRLWSLADLYEPYNPAAACEEESREADTAAGPTLAVPHRTPDRPFRSAPASPATPASTFLNYSLDVGALALTPKRRVKGRAVTPVCIGEMVAHGDSVNHLVVCDNGGFASCSSDKTVILWKQGAYEAEARSQRALEMLHRESSPRT